jgi:twinkle protein
MMHERHIQWIDARGIDPELAERFGMFTKSDGSGNWLAVPYIERGQTVNHKYRLTADKRHRMDPDAPLTLWNHDALLEPEVVAGAAVVITEGEWDALVAIQCGFRFAVSVPNGAPQMQSDNPFEERRYQWFQRSKTLLDEVRTFILAVDGDEPGRVLAADLARLFGPERCKFVEYPDGCKDLNEVFLAKGGPAVADILASAKPYPIKGLYKFDDFPEPPPVQSLGVGIVGLDEMFPLVPGTFSVITGYAGQGKTSLLLVMLANLLKAGVPMAVASFETQVKPILLRRLRSAIYGVEESDPACYRTGPADALLREKLSIIAQVSDDEDSDMTLEYLIELAKTAVIRDGIRLLVIDPWNEIEHKRGGNETETDYTGRAIRELKRFARLYGCAVWLVAHPRKPQGDGRPKAPTLYDLAGSANFANKADYGLVVHRTDSVSTCVDVRCAKVRMGLPGRMGRITLEWSKKTMSYAPLPGFEQPT